MTGFIFSLLEDLWETAKRGIVLMGRILEYSITGQTEYQIYSGEIADFDRVSDVFKAKILLKETQKIIRERFGIYLRRPVVINLFAGNEFNLRGILCQLEGTMGQYLPQEMGKEGIIHMIYILKGLDKKRFRSVVAHELTHAFIREKKLLQTNRHLREGLARWVEYKILQQEGLLLEAEKLKRLKTWKYGKAINNILTLEEKKGERKVLDLLERC